MEQTGAEPAQVIDPAVTYLVTSSLEGVVQRGTGRALNESGRWEGVAGKTGTSNDWRDAWFVAYSANLVVGVWVGFDDGRSLKLTGAGAALPIVASFFRQLNEAVGREPFEVPQGISEGYVQLAGGDSWGECGTREVFLEGTEPEGEGCGWQAAHHWESLRDWGRDMERRARRYLEEVITERLDRRGPRR